MSIILKLTLLPGALKKTKNVEDIFIPFCQGYVGLCDGAIFNNKYKKSSKH
jgi:hypothetical protein